jgi:hypothetical protein
MAELISVKPAEDGAPAPQSHPARPAAAAQLLAAYKQMLVAMFVATLLISAAAMAITLGFHYGNKTTDPAEIALGRGDPPLMVILIFAGALGAFFSSLIRLYDFADLPKALIDPNLGLGKMRSGYLMIYSLVPPVVGAIAATILYIAFAAGLLQGVLFPAFECKLGSRELSECNTFGHTISDFGPKVATDYAKCLVWAFIAGFAERLVPDALHSFAAKAAKSDQAA